MKIFWAFVKVISFTYFRTNVFLFVLDKTSTPNTRCIYLPGIICCFLTILSFLKLAEITPHHYTLCHRLTSEPKVSTLADKRLNFLFINDFVHEEGDALLHQFLKQMRCLWGRKKDAIASSDITKAPFVTPIAEEMNSGNY